MSWGQHLSINSQKEPFFQNLWIKLVCLCIKGRIHKILPIFCFDFKNKFNLIYLKNQTKVEVRLRSSVVSAVDPGSKGPGFESRKRLIFCVFFFNAPLPLNFLLNCFQKLARFNLSSSSSMYLFEWNVTSRVRPLTLCVYKFALWNTYQFI